MFVEIDKSPEVLVSFHCADISSTKFNKHAALDIQTAMGSILSFYLEHTN